MRNTLQKKQYASRLQSLKTAEAKAKKSLKTKSARQLSTRQLSTLQLLKKEHDQGQQEDLQRLQQVVKKIKINTLVDQFVYKMKRNIVSKQPVEYKMIQKSLTQMKSYQSYMKAFNFNQKLVALFMIANIFSILIIQTLAAFQGFYITYAQEDSKQLYIVVLEYFCLTVFFLKLLYSFLCNQNLSRFREKYIRYVAKYYFFSLLFVFDFMNFLMTLLKVLFPTLIVTGAFCFIVTAFSLPVLSKDFQIVETVFFNNYRKRQYFSVFKIFIFNIFFAQFVSSILVAISYFNLQDNWITKATQTGTIHQNIPWWQLYFYAMYWAVATLTTIGYGDLTPANYFEVIFVSIMMLVGTAVLSYNLSEIASVISNLRKVDKRRKEQTMIFKRMAKDESVSEELMEKILDYIEKSSEVREQFQFKERKRFLQELPQQLKEQFQIQYSNHTFSKIPFFNLLQFSTLVKMSSKFKGTLFYPGQNMTRKDTSLPSIMFLKHGKAGFAYHKKDSILNGLVLETRQINQYKDSPYLLNKYLLTSDRQINYQIIAQNYCFVLILQYDQFYEALRESKKDNQFYFSLYSRVSYIDQQWDQFECKYCAPKKHTVFLCPKLHYMPYKSIIQQKHILAPNVPQNRIMIYKRKDYGLKSKKPLCYWKDFLKFVQIEFAAGYTKKQSRKMSKTLQTEEDKQTMNETQYNTNEMIINVTQEVLRLHCCELNQKYEKKKEIQIDKMHNFAHFFPQNNPGNLRMMLLKSSPKLRYKIKLKF